MLPSPQAPRGFARIRAREHLQVAHETRRDRGDGLRLTSSSFLFSGWLPVTGRTARHYFLALQLVLTGKLWTFCRLVEAFRRPFHLKHLVTRANEVLGIAMTLQTPLHLQRRDLPCLRHLIDSTVTGRTPDTLVHVNTVIEIDEVRQVVNPSPLERRAGTPALANWLKILTIGEELRVAVHTGFCRRYSCRSSRLDCCMAIPAIDSVIADVMFMRELNRLILRHIRLGDVRRAIDLIQEPAQEAGNKDAAKDAHFGNRVTAVVEDLRHSSSPTHSRYPTYFARVCRDNFEFVKFWICDSGYFHDCFGIVKKPACSTAL